MITIKDKRGAIIEVASPYYIDNVYEKVVIKKLGNKTHDEYVHVLGSYKDQGRAWQVIKGIQNYIKQLYRNDIYKHILVMESTIREKNEYIARDISDYYKSDALFEMPEE